MGGHTRSTRFGALIMDTERIRSVLFRSGNNTLFVGLAAFAEPGLVLKLGSERLGNA